MRILTLIVIGLLLNACSAQKKSSSNNLTTEVINKSDEEQVRDCFANYKSSILNDRGEEAVKYVDRRTIKYYQDILDKTKNADSTAINDMNIMDKLMVFSIRHRTPKEEILEFDGKKLLVYAIKEGMVGKNSVMNNEVGDIDIDHDFAKGQLVVSGTPAPMYFHFYKEQENWKINLTSIFPIATQAFQSMADESGEEENEYLFTLLELITGKRPTSQIWDTIK